MAQLRCPWPGHRPEDGVPCDPESAAAWGVTNNCTINIFMPSFEPEDQRLMTPVFLTPRRSDGQPLFDKHVDLLFFDGHWFLILCLPTAFTGKPAKYSLCLHCLGMAHPEGTRCGTDATVAGLAPAAEGATYTAKSSHFVTWLPLPFVGVLALRHADAPPLEERDPELEYVGDEERDEVVWTLGGHINTVRPGCSFDFLSLLRRTRRSDLATQPAHSPLSSSRLCRPSKTPPVPRKSPCRTCRRTWTW